MIKETKHIPYQRVDISDMNSQQLELLNKAKEASTHAYAPYSKFKVGAALLLDNGEIITGSNQENAAYPSGLCAERTALFYAHHRYPDASIKTLVIVAFQNDAFLSSPIMPCGSCVQVFSESIRRTKNTFEVLLYGNDYSYLINDARDFIPFRFDLSE